jgi:hypothetical protein
MYPDFEKTKIIDNVVYCNIGQSLQLNSFGFSFNDINDVKLNKQISITVNNVKHTRVCSLIQDVNKNLYLRFRRITEDFEDNMICQFYYKSKDFKCASCNQFYQGQDLKDPCCPMKTNLIIFNTCEIYQIDFLTISNFNYKKGLSKEEFISLHFGSVVDTIMLGEPV